MSWELTAAPYTMKLDVECATSCCGSILRLPDGVEGRFSHTEGLWILLESMGGRRWWQENHGQIEARVLSFAAAQAMR